MNRIIAASLREAMKPFHGQLASPQTIYRIKKAFIDIAKRNGVDLRRDARRIRLEFRDGKSPNLIIPPDLLTTH